MKSEKISTFLQSRIDAKDFPSAVYLVAEKGEIIFEDALGAAVVEPQRIEARTDTIYDLASLTKPLVTGLLCAKLMEAGKMSLSEKISKYFGEFGTSEKNEITIAYLLTHVSGFLNWKPFYLSANTERRTNAVFSEIVETELENPICKKVVYSDFNFILLGFILERIHDKPLDLIFDEEILQPLNLRNTFYNPPPELRERIAAAEKGNEYEKQMCANLGYEVSNYLWRDYQIWGEVHDGNCWFMKGVSGHAGLFSTAKETFKIARQFLAGQTVLLKPETCRLFHTNFTWNFNEARSAAFQLAATKDSTASETLSKESFGHLGFTGTSLWIEPVSERIYILLTNRTHDRELPFANINDARRRFHEIASSELEINAVRTKNPKSKIRNPKSEIQNPLRAS